jgi:hypothetical protein
LRNSRARSERPIRPLENKRLLVVHTQSLPRLYDDWTLVVPLSELDLPVGVFDVAVRVKSCASCELMSASHRVIVVRIAHHETIACLRRGRMRSHPA